MAFSYKHFLVIGATAGIGLELAEQLIKDGRKVTAVGRRQERLDQFVKKHNNNNNVANGISFDISDLKKIPEFVDKVTSEAPDIDALVLNAGIQLPYNLADRQGFDLEKFHHEILVNFSSMVSLVHAFLPWLLAKSVPTSILV